MKHLKIAILALLCVVAYNNANAQDEENPWMLNFSTNVIDVTDGESGNILPWLSKISATRYLGKGFGLELAGSVNKIERPWSEGEATYAAIDLNFKYDLNKILGDTKWFDPYLYAGVGENWVGTKDGLSLNLGFGFNSWFNDHLGMNIQTGYKSVNTPEDFKMWQHAFGLVWRFGKTDTDGDGIRDKDDECPTVEGLAEFNGCPDKDSDDDGVNDCCDKCPDTPGLKEFHGCPDTDGDGVPDKKDKCPETPGLKSLYGCPDKDGDGVPDSQDACPDVAGPKTNAGCPFKDTDGDGVIDLVDNCVDVPGPASNNGCPEVFEDYKTVDEAAKGIVFDTGKFELRDAVKEILDEVADILNANHNLRFNFNVDGHTDSTGSNERNMVLSNDRANAVRDYLISKGVNSNRLDIRGFGEDNPIDTNDTREGRQNNRRVEIKEKK
jgi:outer membrane protein OmpA-like peptidoglycan-associated protein